MPHDLEEFKQIVARLREPFPPEVHQERDLPGGKSKWFYISWQDIRDRLNDVCPDHEVSYSMPKYSEDGEYCTILCTLTICGVSRTLPGSVKVRDLSSAGKDMSRGNPVDRAVAESLKNAAEAFGVAAYLDDQTQDKREFTLRYLHGKGDTRAKTYAVQNGWLEKKELKPATKSAPMRRASEEIATTIAQPQPAPIPTGDWEETRTIDLSSTIAQISAEVERVGWTKKQGSNYLQATYGKKTRAELTDTELVEFLEYLKAIPAMR